MKQDRKFKLEVVSVRLVKDAPVYSDHKIHSPLDAVDVVGGLLCEMDREVMCVLNLKVDGTPINCNIVSMGTVNATLAHPREMFKASILSNAANMMMLHNHPGNQLQPSQADIKITDRMLHLTQLMDIPLLDHIIVGTDTSRYFSFKEKGMITISAKDYVTDYRQLNFFEMGTVAEPGKAR